MIMKDGPFQTPLFVYFLVLFKGFQHSFKAARMAFSEWNDCKEKNEPLHIKITITLHPLYRA